MRAAWQPGPGPETWSAFLGGAREGGEDIDGFLPTLPHNNLPERVGRQLGGTQHRTQTGGGNRYGGSVMRANIAEQADWYVYDFDPLVDALPR